MPLHQAVEESAQRRQVKIPLGGRATQADEVLTDHAGRDRRQLNPLTLAPGQEAFGRRHVRLLRVRVVMLGIEEFVPGEAGGPPCPHDQRRQSLRDGRLDMLAFGNRH